MDKSLPDYKNEPSEFESVRQVKFTGVIAAEVKQFTQRIRAEHGLAGLEHLINDVKHSALVNNIPAKEQIRRLLNQRAEDLGYKGKLWN